MQGLVPLGRVLVGLAVVSLVGELTARSFFGAGGYLSAEALWVVLAPDSHAALRAWFHRSAPGLWTYGLGLALKLPAWLLFGAPGIAALWLGEREDVAAEAAEAAEAAFLYDELTKQARAEGFPAEAERPSAAGGDEVLESAREAQADLAREPIPHPPPRAEAEKEEEKETPSRPPS